MLKKPSNAKDVEKLAPKNQESQQQPHHRVLDKSELEYIEALKVISLKGN